MSYFLVCALILFFQKLLFKVLQGTDVNTN